MPNITLPDGSVRSYDGPVSGATIASDIGPGLAKAALIAIVDGDAEGVGYAMALEQEVSPNSEVAPIA